MLLEESVFCGSIRIFACPKLLVNLNASSQMRREALGE